MVHKRKLLIQSIQALAGMQSTPTDVDSSMKYVISLRVERPVELCELAPNSFLYIRGGNMDNQTRAKIMDANPHTFSYSWRKSAKKQICENTFCPRKDCFDPSHWCRNSLGGHILQCAVCERAGVPRHESTFCTKSCFISAWEQHCKNKHVSLAFSSSKNSIAAGIRDVVEEYPAEFARKGSFDNSDSNSLVMLPVSGAVSTNPIIDNLEWQLVSTERVYAPTVDDVGSVLRVDVKAIAVNGGHILAGPVSLITDTILSHPRAPPKRPLLTVSNSNLLPSTSSNAGARFRVISYNILAELYATKQAYPYCEAWILAWTFRLTILLQEIEDAQGDIICLQEVQADHYEQYILPFMQERGFDSLYKPKSRESMGQYGKVDGCATFWRRSKFMMIENFSIDFNEQARQAASDLGLDETEGRWYMNKLLRDNIAQVLVLEVISRSAVRLPRQSMQLCVVNTHLYANHMKPDVKLWQALTLMNQLEQFVLTRDVALLLCGDLNSEPTSAVYEYIFEGGLVLPHPELNPSDGVVVLPDSHKVCHNVELESAMCSAMGVEPEFTNFTAKFRGTLDYICFSPSRLRVMGVSQIPESAEFEALVGVGLPCVNFPSDHIMLCCDFAFVITGTGALTRNTKRKGIGSQGIGMLSNRKSGRGF